MNEQFVTYEIALKLKEMGFDEPCLGIFGHNQKIYTNSKPEHFESQEKVQYIFGIGKLLAIQAPLWQQAIDFLRNKYFLHVSVLPYQLNEDGCLIPLCWYYTLTDISCKENICLNEGDLGASKDNFDYPEKAREMGILKAIERLEEKKPNKELFKLFVGDKQIAVIKESNIAHLEDGE